MFDVNNFALTGVPKFYKPNMYGTSIAIEISGQQKYLWVNVDHIGYEGNKKPPFTEQEFKSAQHIVIIGLRMDSYVDKKTQGTRYSAKVSGKKVLLSNSAQNFNMGFIAGEVDLVNAPKRGIRVKMPYMYEKEVRYRSALVKWTDDSELPEMGDQVLAIGSIGVNDSGTPYIVSKRIHKWKQRTT